MSQLWRRRSSSSAVAVLPFACACYLQGGLGEEEQGKFYRRPDRHCCKLLRGLPFWRTTVEAEEEEEAHEEDEEEDGIGIVFLLLKGFKKC